MGVTEKYTFPPWESWKIGMGHAKVHTESGEVVRFRFCWVPSGTVRNRSDIVGCEQVPKRIGARDLHAKNGISIGASFRPDRSQRSAIGTCSPVLVQNCRKQEDVQNRAPLLGARFFLVDPVLFEGIPCQAHHRKQRKENFTHLGGVLDGI